MAETIHLEAVRIATATDRSLYCDLDGLGGFPRLLNILAVEILRRTDAVPPICFKGFADELLPLRRNAKAFLLTADRRDREMQSASSVEQEMESAPTFG